MKKKFAFLLMGDQFDTGKHQTKFETETQDTYIFTVNSLESAYETVTELYREGFGAIELCGAFGEAAAEKMIELTEGKMVVGYVTHKPEQDALVEKFFVG